MKKITLDEWEKRYIVGPIERFEQKNVMFTRPMWDPEIKDLLQDWSITGMPRDKSGYTLEDMALRWGSNAGTRMASIGRQNTNPSPERTPVLAAVSASNETRSSVIAVDSGASASNRPGAFAAYRLPEGAKTDTSDIEKVTNMIKKAARWFGADLVGICKLDRRWLYAATPPDARPAVQETSDDFQYAVVMAYEMNYDLLKYYSTYITNSATRMGYSRMAVTNAHLASFIRNLGFQAIESGNDTALSVPMAMQAGLGELGRNGILITPDFGPRIRLSKVITDLPLLADTPIEFGVTEFCLACEKCADSCPTRSIMTGDRTTEANNISNNPGVLKWPINAETCRIYWSRTTPCVACIASCPYNKPHTWPHRTVRWFTDHARWADALFVKGDDLLGYGKPHEADNFWEEWHPENGYAKSQK